MSGQVRDVPVTFDCVTSARTISGDFDPIPICVGTSCEDSDELIDSDADIDFGVRSMLEDAQVPYCEPVPGEESGGLGDTQLAGSSVALIAALMTGFAFLL
jgi:hypothetical protein